MKVLKWLIYGIVAVGMYRGYLNYAATTDADNVSIALRLVNTAIDTVADLTYQWIPPVVDTIGNLAGDNADPAAFGGQQRW